MRARSHTDRLLAAGALAALALVACAPKQRIPLDTCVAEQVTVYVGGRLLEPGRELELTSDEPHKMFFKRAGQPPRLVVLQVAEDADGVCGTVQLILQQPENQPHRAELSKMLVHRRARRRGLGEALMRAAETTARECGKTLLVLDTANPDAERLYERLGWERVGVIPDYALLPHGGLCGTTVYYRRLTG